MPALCLSPSRLQPVECRGVVVKNLLLHLRCEMTSLPGNYILRERPSAIGVRVVGGPHHVPVTEELDQMQPNVVRLIGRPNLPPKNVAWHLLESDFIGRPCLEKPLVAEVHLLNH